MWSLYGGASSRDESGFAGDALSAVVLQLLALQPEAAGHLRCLAWGPGPPTSSSPKRSTLSAPPWAGTCPSHRGLLRRRRPGRQADRSTLDYGRRRTARANATSSSCATSTTSIEPVSFSSQAQKPRRSTSRSSPASPKATTAFSSTPGSRTARRGHRSPVRARVWQRRPTRPAHAAHAPRGHAGRHQLASAAKRRRRQLARARRPDPGARSPHRRPRGFGQATARSTISPCGSQRWTATPPATASNERWARDNVAILHQESASAAIARSRSLSARSPAGPADRAIGRSLRAAGIIPNRDIAMSVGTKLRKVASQGYGILALQAATSGAGINELVGHVVAFSMLATTTTPWPLPPGCRVLLVSLDEYRHWFTGKRADLLAIALDHSQRGVHVAAIEVKARRTDADIAARDALDQLNQTLAATRWAAYPKAGSITAAYGSTASRKPPTPSLANPASSSTPLSCAPWKTSGSAVEASSGPASDWSSGPSSYPSTPDLPARGRARHRPNCDPRRPADRATARRRHRHPPDYAEHRRNRPRTPLASTSDPTSARTRNRRSASRRQCRRHRRRACRERRSRRSRQDRATDTGSSRDSTSVNGNDPKTDGSEIAAGESSAAAPPSVQPRPEAVATEPPPGVGASVASTARTGATGVASSFVAPLLGWDAATDEPVHWHPAGPGQSVLRTATSRCGAPRGWARPSSR